MAAVPGVYICRGELFGVAAKSRDPVCLAACDGPREKAIRRLAVKSRAPRTGLPDLSGFKEYYIDVQPRDQAGLA
jgi:hypothetical protein